MPSRYARKIMQPLLVILDPCDEPAELVCHDGQEFNYVLEGSLILTFGDRDIQLNAGDSIYFNPTYPPRPALQRRRPLQVHHHHHR